MNQKKKQAQELITNRVLAIFVFIVLLLFGMSFLNRIIIYGSTFMTGMLVDRIVAIVSAAATVIFYLLYLRGRKLGTFHGERVFNTAFFALCSLVTCACSLVLQFNFYYGMRILYILLPVIGVLYLIYHVYDRQFFTFSVVQAASITAVYCSYVGAFQRVYMTILAAVLCVALMLLSLQKSDKGKKLTAAVLGKQFDRRYTLLVYAGTLAVLAAAFFLQGKAALVLGIAEGVYLLGSAVYYTVRAM